MSDDVVALRTLPDEALAAHRAAVKVVVLSGFGLNCEVETEHAFKMAGARVERVHLTDLLDGSRHLSEFHIVAFPGGFAFGDHLGAGFVFANRIRHRMYDRLVAFIEQGGLAIGICNGFQMMTRLGMLPGLDGDYRTPRATLAPNDQLGYRNAWVRLKVNPDSPCVWTQGLSGLDLPSRHGEGKFLVESADLLEQMESAGQVAVRYVDARGEPTEAWPANPNGSPGGIAGVCDPSGRLFGMMPHPDAFLFPFQHPHWCWQGGAADSAEGEGLAVFRNGVDTVAAAV